jgi:hypothetical protein
VIATHMNAAIRTLKARLRGPPVFLIMRSHGIVFSLIPLSPDELVLPLFRPE